jgi:D-alanyl-D-alanine carboxypeptidase
VPRLDRRTFIARSAIACALPATLTACVGESTTPVTASYRAAVQRVMAQYFIPGVLVSVRRPGDPEWKQAFGYADVATQAPFNLQSHFSIRSVTKSFTVTLQLMLAGDQLDQPIGALFPEVPNAATITYADLAGMQSGIADYSSTPEFHAVFGDNLAATFTEQQLVDYALPYSPKFDPGTQYQYSNTNTVLLGMYIAQLTGGTLASAMQRLIFGPLGLTGTAYPDSTPLPQPAATPYEVNISNGALEVLPLISPTSLAGAGAMTSTLDDLQTWALALGTGSLLTPALQAERLSRQRPVTNGPQYENYGLGIGFIKGWRGHTGTGIGWQAAAMYDPVSKATIAVSVNATPALGAPDELNFAQAIFEALADVVATG